MAEAWQDLSASSISFIDDGGSNADWQSCGKTKDDVQIEFLWLSLAEPTAIYPRAQRKGPPRSHDSTALVFRG